METICHSAEQLLNDVFARIGFDITLTTKADDSTCFINFEGSDALLLRSEGGELLEAVDHLVNQCFTSASKQTRKIVCDVQGFRAAREAELRAMAYLAAKNVRSSNQPYTFGYLTADERRIVHTCLQDESDLQSESFGEGNARRLRITLKHSS